MTITISRLPKEEFERLLPQLVAVYESANEDLPEYARHGNVDITQYLTWLFDGDPQGFFVARDDGQLAALESIHGNWHDRQGNILTEIHEVSVKKEYQGKGIGGTLLRLALEYARSLGRRKVGLWVGENNTRAEAIYRKMGFVQTSTWGIWKRLILELPEVDESGEGTG